MQDLDEKTRDLLGKLTAQLAERQNAADTQQSTYLDLRVTTASSSSSAAATAAASESGGGGGGGGGVETVSFVFSDAERRAQWEECFADVKMKMGKTISRSNRASKG